MAIYISGSVAYDRIMNFPGNFMDSILPDQIHNLNVSFFIDNLDEKLGGCAGNIAYTLYLLSEKPTIVATVGKDFSSYATLLEERGLPLEGITRLDDVLTASAYIMTDQRNSQITGFHAAAMMTPSTYTFPNLDPAIDIALIGPSNPKDMNDHPALYKKNGIRYIFDPSQQLPMFTGEQLLACIEGAYLLVGNEYEIQLVEKTTGKTKQELQALTTRGIVTTLGAEGALVSENGCEERKISAVSVSKVVDPTGAGDAFRSGLLKGIVLEQSLVESARLGATCAAFCIEQQGTQVHDFSMEDFFKRHSAAFGHSV